MNVKGHIQRKELFIKKMKSILCELLCNKCLSSQTMLSLQLCTGVAIRNFQSSFLCPSPLIVQFPPFSCTLFKYARCKRFFKTQTLNGCAFLNPTYSSHENINSWKGEQKLHIIYAISNRPSSDFLFYSQKEALQRLLKAVVPMDYFIKGCHIIEHIPSASLGHVPTTWARPLFLVLLFLNKFSGIKFEQTKPGKTLHAIEKR